MSKHTPGPWKIGYGGKEEDDYAVITSPHSQRAICNLEPKDYMPSNARLITAAPDLLAACKAALEMCPFPVGTSFVKEQLQNAIAKAQNLPKFKDIIGLYADDKNEECQEEQA